jgi:2-oxoglutarate ferredoxin oxidoreductase subunit alpha
MSELINLAVMAEVPAVILDVQRGGPSTGLPTRTEQGDLNIAVYGGAGDSPRIVLAPADVAEVYRFIEDALWLAEKYQTPVVVLMDFFLANRVETVAPLAPRPERFPAKETPPASSRDAPYLRYALTPSGISPRALPGMKGLAHTATGLEHTEAALPDYGPANHAAMTEKRWRKIQGAGADAPPPRFFGAEGAAEVGVLAWGSSTGAAVEAVERARAEGIAAAGIALPTLWPFPAEAVAAFLDRCGAALCPEVNRWGQLAQLASGATGRPVRPLPLPAEPPEASSILAAIRAAMG